MIFVLYLSVSNPLPILYLSFTYPLAILYLSFIYPLPILYISFTYPLYILHLSVSNPLPLPSFINPFSVFSSASEGLNDFACRKWRLAEGCGTLGIPRYKSKWKNKISTRARSESISTGPLNISEIKGTTIFVRSAYNYVQNGRSGNDYGTLGQKSIFKPQQKIKS